MNRTPGTAKFIAKLGTPTRGSTGNLFEIFRESMHTMRTKFQLNNNRTWSFSETMALEAFIHISDDAITSNYQSGDNLPVRVAEEAKPRYNGDWMRSPYACNK
jgi:hypothetical protein